MEKNSLLVGLFCFIFIINFSSFSTAVSYTFGSTNIQSTATCINKTCGDDGSGGSCGTCASGSTCMNAVCIVNENQTINSNATKIYVSLQGNDNNPGTIDKPFKTLEKARDYIRSLARPLSVPINVYLRAGTYELSSTFILEKQDSGEEGKPITYQAYPGEKVIISGGKTLENQWTKYNDNIYVANVGSLRFNSLFVDGKRAIRARTPNEGEGFYANVVPIYRFYNNNNKSNDHIFISSESEKNKVAGHASWIYEGIEGYTYRGPQSTPFQPDRFYNGTVPIYRFYNPSTGIHFFTANASEKKSIESNSSWQSEGIVFYILTMPRGDGVPLYKFLYPGNYASFYTTSESEKTKLLNNTVWKYVGIEGYIYPKTDGSESESAYQNNTKAFYFAKGEINESWRNLNDLEIISFRRWEQSRSKIENVTGNKVYFPGALRTAHEKAYGWDYGGYDRYYVENVFEGLDSPQEWYLDNNTGELYYWPPAGKGINEMEFVAPIMKTIMEVGNSSAFLDSVVNVTDFTDYVGCVQFVGLIFSDADWKLKNGWYGGGVTAYSGSEPAIILVTNNSKVQNCEFTNSGNYALGMFSKNTEVSGNKFHNLGGGGILIGRQDFPELLQYRYLAKEVTSNNISYNEIYNTGEVYKEAGGITVLASGNNLVSHNLVYNTSYTGIYLGGTPQIDKGVLIHDNIIENNEIHDVMRELNDGAGVYIAGGQQPGTIVRNNLIYDVIETKNHLFDFALWGIYLEGETAHIRIEKNIVYRTTYGGLMFFNAKNNNYNNSASNNIFVDGRDFQTFFDSASNDSFTNNIVYYNKNKGKLFEFVGGGALNYSNNNLFYSPSDPTINQQIADWKKYGFDSNSIVTDPLFVDYADDDFRLSSDSPALKSPVNFKPIDISNIGII
jgi:hypothetical protein